MMKYLINMNKNFRITLLLSGFIVFIIVTPFVGVFWLLSFIMSFVFLGLLIASNVKNANNYSNIMEKSLEKSLIKLNFHADYSYLSDDYLSGIALNKLENKIAILKRENVNQEFIPTFYKFNDVLECSIQEDSQTIIKTVNNSMIGRAVVGGVLFGGIGVVAGALSGEKMTSEKIFRATLSLVFDNIDYPIHEINFLNSKMLIDRNSELYQKIYSDLNMWYKTISVIIKQNEREQNSKSV